MSVEDTSIFEQAERQAADLLQELAARRADLERRGQGANCDLALAGGLDRIDAAADALTSVIDALNSRSTAGEDTDHE